MNDLAGSADPTLFPNLSDELAWEAKVGTNYPSSRFHSWQ
jgi:hypothetical protein